jgi:hypothetical protein
LEREIKKESKEEKKEKKKQLIEKKLKAQWEKEERMLKLNITEDKSEKRTKDGLKIYTEEELNIGNGGNTNKCPIDCDCCF